MLLVMGILFGHNPSSALARHARCLSSAMCKQATLKRRAGASSRLNGEDQQWCPPPKQCCCCDITGKGVLTSTSRPLSAAGRPCAWIAVGVWYLCTAGLDI